MKRLPPPLTQFWMATMLFERKRPISSALLSLPSMKMNFLVGLSSDATFTVS
jgi:hypothetical protein